MYATSTDCLAQRCRLSWIKCTHWVEDWSSVEYPTTQIHKYRKGNPFAVWLRVICIWRMLPRANYTSFYRLTRMVLLRSFSTVPSQWPNDERSLCVCVCTRARALTRCDEHIESTIQIMYSSNRSWCGRTAERPQQFMSESCASTIDQRICNWVYAYERVWCAQQHVLPGADSGWVCTVRVGTLVTNTDDWTHLECSINQLHCITVTSTIMNSSK